MRYLTQIHDPKPEDVRLTRYQHKGQRQVCVTLGEHVKIYGAPADLLATFWKVTEALDPMTPAEAKPAVSLPELPDDPRARTIFDVEVRQPPTAATSLARELKADAEIERRVQVTKGTGVHLHHQDDDVERYAAESRLSTGFDMTVPGELTEQPIEMTFETVAGDASDILSKMKPGARGEIHYAGEVWPVEVGPDISVEDDGVEIIKVPFKTDRVADPNLPPLPDITQHLVYPSPALHTSIPPPPPPPPPPTYLEKRYGQPRPLQEWGLGPWPPPDDIEDQDDIWDPGDAVL